MDICRASSRTVTTSSAQSAPRTSCSPTTDQSQTSIKYCDLVTNHRPVLWSCDQSQTSIVFLWPFGTSGRCDHLLESWSGVDPDFSQSGKRELLNIWLSFSSFTSHIHFLQQSPCQNILHQIPAPSRFSLLLHFHVDIVHNSSQVLDHLQCYVIVL